MATILINSNEVANTTNTLSTINNNEDMNLVTQGNGALNFFGGGGFNVHSDGLLSSVVFNVQPSGLTTIQNADPAVGTAVLSISANPSPNVYPLSNSVTGAVLHATGAISGPATVKTGPSGVNYNITPRL